MVKTFLSTLPSMQIAYPPLAIKYCKFTGWPKATKCCQGQHEDDDAYFVALHNIKKYILIASHAPKALYLYRVWFFLSSFLKMWQHPTPMLPSINLNHLLHIFTWLSAADFLQNKNGGFSLLYSCENRPNYLTYKLNLLGLLRSAVVAVTGNIALQTLSWGASIT